MSFWHILRFEFRYQFRRAPIWLFFGTLALVAGLQVRLNFVADALYDEFYVNSPFVIAVVSVFGTLVWLLAAASVAGDAASRDLQTRMYALTYTTPVSRAGYLMGRFAAALLLNAWIMLGIPMGVIAATYLPGTDPVVIGPFRPEAYLTALAYITLPNALIATAVQFCFAALFRTAKAAYLGSLLLLFTTFAVSMLIGVVFGRPDLARLADPVGMMSIVSELSSTWTPVEKGTRLITFEGTLLANRVLWAGISVAVLALTCLRFRFSHTGSGGRRVGFTAGKGTVGAAEMRSRDNAVALASARPSFGARSRLAQTFRIMRVTFGQLARSRSGLLMLTVFAGLAILIIPVQMNNMGVPLEPRSGYLVTFLTAPVTHPLTTWVIIPLLIIFYTGEVVWREREAGTDAITDTAPVPEWVFFLGKFLGVCLLLVVWTGLLAAAGMAIQARMALRDPDTALLFRILFGLQLPEYILFGLLVLVVHIVVNHKAAGHLVALAVFGLISFGSWIGLEHHLLLYGNGPRWSYSEMRGFGQSIEPWLWFRIYWAGWALLLALAGRLLWVRSREADLKERFLMAGRRLTGASVWVGIAGLLLVLGTGGYIWYNTNVLNEYRTHRDSKTRRAEYERRFSGFAGIAQPVIAATRLHMEIFPKTRGMTIRGTHQLVNSQARALDSIHIATIPGVQTRILGFDQAAAGILSDDELGHHIFRLSDPLQPGDSVRVRFEVVLRSDGFTNSGIRTAVMGNSTMFYNEDWLPDIGYQPRRELQAAGDRRAYGLAPRPPVPDLDQADARRIMAAGRRIQFEAIVGTAGDQTAIAPGSLRRSWSTNGRRYFQYVAEAPIQNQYAIFSAKYALFEGMHRGVKIQIFHHPAHTKNIERMFRAAKASLDYHTRQYGPYPYKQVRLIEEAGKLMGMHAEAMQITYGEGFSLMDPAADQDAVDLPFAVVGHEMAHQWWGHQLKPAHVAGAPVLAESLAWYSAMGVIEEAAGREQLERLRTMMRQPYPVRPVRPSVPLLHAVDAYQAYRKGPFAFFALSAYIGRDRVDAALRSLLQKHLQGSRLATTRDLYNELQAVTPAAYRSLLSDLFEKNTFWELKTEEATARRLDSGMYRVRLQIRAGKFRVNGAGRETAVALNDSIPIGVFAGDSKTPAQTLYLKNHPIRSGKTVIEIIVHGKPSLAGIDPNYLLIDEKPENNNRKVKVEET